MHRRGEIDNNTSGGGRRAKPTTTINTHDVAGSPATNTISTTKNSTTSAGNPITIIWQPPLRGNFHTDYKLKWSGFDAENIAPTTKSVTTGQIATHQADDDNGGSRSIDTTINNTSPTIVGMRVKDPNTSNSTGSINTDCSYDSSNSSDMGVIDANDELALVAAAQQQQRQRQLLLQSSDVLSDLFVKKLHETTVRSVVQRLQAGDELLRQTAMLLGEDAKKREYDKGLLHCCMNYAFRICTEPLHTNASELC